MGLHNESTGFLPPEDQFDQIANALYREGWIVLPDFIDDSTWLALLQRAQSIEDYSRAGIGRGDDFQENRFVRTDHICWLNPANTVDNLWLGLMERLRTALNRRLFLGLFEFESHYAKYEPGQYYRRHLDAFKGQGNRVVSVVCYLNPAWQPADGGELVIYPDNQPDGIRFLPQAGTVAVFLSEDFPHEVLASQRQRFSIAGWFRVNASTADRIDPAA